MCTHTHTHTHCTHRGIPGTAPVGRAKLSSGIEAILPIYTLAATPPACAGEYVAYIGIRREGWRVGCGCAPLASQTLACITYSKAISPGELYVVYMHICLHIRLKKRKVLARVQRTARWGKKKLNLQSADSEEKL